MEEVYEDEGGGGGNFVVLKSEKIPVETSKAK
jgi:hypothetical protein